MSEKIRVAVLSNVNMDYAALLLKDKFDVFQNEGYGELFGPQLDESSALHRFGPQAVVLLVDLDELLAPGQGEPEAVIDGWFETFDRLRREEREYFISDAWFRRPCVEDLDDFFQEALRARWQDRLRRACGHGNVHRLPLDSLSMAGLTRCFSDKMWYLGKMPFSASGCQMIAGAIRDSLDALYARRRKVLALDLDGTLWGGILGECGPEGIVLSNEGAGAAYRDAQRLILQMKRHGVILAVSSKNNEEDVKQVFSSHPWMALKLEDFSFLSVNWREKTDNLIAMAQALNVGLASFVFVDDRPEEREAVRLRLPEVAVPEFPKEAEKLPAFFREIYESYFKKSRSTEEDLEKTKQYADHIAREELRSRLSYEEYLASLELKAELVAWSEDVAPRVLQLLQKTNQFNLTARRYDRAALEMRIGEGWLPYVFRVSDRFGSYGIAAVLLVEPRTPRVDVFLMSCRAMGKRLEEHFLKVVEEDLRRRGYTQLWAEYIPSRQNMPVSRLYDKLGCRLVRQEDGKRVYMRDLAGEDRISCPVNCPADEGE